MNEKTPTNSAFSFFGRRLFWRRTAIAALLGTAVAGAGAAAWAHGGDGFGCCGFRHAHQGAVTPERAAKMADLMVDHLLEGIEASGEQRTRINAVVASAMTELAPMRKRHHELRDAAVAALAAPSVDRGALEQLRQEQLRMADAFTRRISDALAQIAEILTPEQRAAAAARLQTMRGWRHG